MNRRDALAATGSLVSLAALSALAEGKADAKAPAKVTPPVTAPTAPSADVKALENAAEACVDAAEECFELCLKTLTAGDTGMADCLASVRQMLPVCETLETLAKLNSVHLKAYAAVCAKVCRDCEAVCKKHSQHHAECKKCMETCAACATACEKFSA